MHELMFVILVNIGFDLYDVHNVPSFEYCKIRSQISTMHVEKLEELVEIVGGIQREELLHRLEYARKFNIFWCTMSAIANPNQPLTWKMHCVRELKTMIGERNWRLRLYPPPTP